MRAFILGMAGFTAAVALGQTPSSYDNCPAAVQDLTQSLSTAHTLTGAQIAVASNGVLTCAGAYGYADSATNRPMTTTTLMRIGSVSKTITGMALAKLYDDGKLDLNDSAVKYFPDLQPATFADPRWLKVTILNMAQHSMGWDRDIGGEPIQQTVAIAKALGIRAPATSTDVVRWMFQQKLHFDPGTKAEYTGIEYSILALIVERVAGMPFEQYVQQAILAPAGIRTSMRVGRTLQEGRAFPADPAYFEAAYFNTLAPIASVFPWITGTVPHPYGEWYNEALEGSGGWTANAPALVRYVNKMFGRPNIPSLFKASTIQAILARPSYEPANSTFYYGIGWQVQQVANGYNFLFSGGLRGTTSHVKYLSNGNTYAFITNYSSENDPGALDDIAAQLNLKVGPLGIAGNNMFNTPKYTDPATPLPTIRAQKGVVQGASFEPGVTVGSWFSIIGWNLGTTTRLWEGADFNQGNKLPTNLDGVEVKINGQPAAVYYISPTQINAQVPNLTVTGTATLQVFRNGVASHPEPIEIRASSPEFFRYQVGAKSYVAALHLDGSVVADPGAVPGYKAATVGETIQIFGTGFAASNAGVIADATVPVANTVVKVGTATAAVTFSGLTATGLFQVNAVVPSLAKGDYAVTVSVGGVPSLVTGLLTIQ